MRTMRELIEENNIGLSDTEKNRQETTQCCKQLLDSQQLISKVKIKTFLSRRNRDLYRDLGNLMQLETAGRTGDCVSHEAIQSQQLVSDCSKSTREHSHAEQKLVGKPL